jgi:hypothetical protein
MAIKNITRGYRQSCTNTGNLDYWQKRYEKWTDARTQTKIIAPRFRSATKKGWTLAMSSPVNGRRYRRHYHHHHHEHHHHNHQVTYSKDILLVI